MTYILLFLIALSAYYLFTSYINKYCWYFTGIILSLVVALYSVFILISITGNYSSIGYVFNDLDRQIFLSVVKSKTNIFYIMRMFNISTAIYLVTLNIRRFECNAQYSLCGIPSVLPFLLRPGNHICNVQIYRYYRKQNFF